MLMSRTDVLYNFEESSPLEHILPFHWNSLKILTNFVSWKSWVMYCYSFDMEEHFETPHNVYFFIFRHFKALLISFPGETGVTNDYMQMQFINSAVCFINQGCGSIVSQQTTIVPKYPHYESQKS